MKTNLMFYYTAGALFAGLLSARAQTNLLDTAFNPGTGVAGGLVETVLPQPDGKVLICGDFLSVNGVPQGFIARLNSDGSVDETFHAGPGYWVRHMALQIDGKIIIGGFFTNVEGQPRNRVARLNQDGSLDTSFDVGLGAQTKIVEGDDKDPFVFAVAVQPDGKILIGGNFLTYNGVARSGLARLNVDGTLDTDFKVGAGANSWVRSLYVMDNGQILVSGWFTNFDNHPFNRMVRLNADGAIDSTFHADFGDKTAVYTMAVQPDGKIVVGGHFSRVNATVRNSVARLNPDGTADETFDPGSGPDDFVECARLQPDGKIVIAGYFQHVNGIERHRVARLNSDGSLDESVKADLDNFAWTAALQPDGKILLSGGFNTVDGISRRGVARLATKGGGIASPRLLTPKLDHGKFQVTVPTVLGHQYTLQYRQLDASRWSARPAVAGDGTMKQFEDPDTAPSSARLYRMVVY